MSSPLGYEDTVELLDAGEKTAPAPQQLVLESVPITIVCTDQANIKAGTESWGWDPRGVVVIDGTWEDGESTEDVLIFYNSIHHVKYHFDELQEGTNPND